MSVRVAHGSFIGITLSSVREVQKSPEVGLCEFVFRGGLLCLADVAGRHDAASDCESMLEFFGVKRVGLVHRVVADDVELAADTLDALHIEAVIKRESEHRVRVEAFYASVDDDEIAVLQRWLHAVAIDDDEVQAVWVYISAVPRDPGTIDLHDLNDSRIWIERLIDAAGRSHIQ